MISSNPALGQSVFANSRVAGSESMTMSGTINKSFVLLALVLATAFWSWQETWKAILNPHLELAQGMGTTGLLLIGAICGFVFALISIFVPKVSPYTAPAYALAEGLLLGALSALMEQRYGGIVFQAVLGSFGTFFFMLFLYQSRMVQATSGFKRGMMAAMGGILFIYVVSFILGFFGKQIPFIHESGPIGIGFSVIVVALAAFSFILDFDSIEQGVNLRAPKYMEWYGAFGLLVTLVWLYLEILRLLGKIRDRR